MTAKSRADRAPYLAPPSVDDAPSVHVLEVAAEASIAVDPLVDAPRGPWVEVTEDGEAWVKARHYVTRMRVNGSVAWVQADCWSTSDPPKFRHRVREPIAWRPIFEASP